MIEVELTPPPDDPVGTVERLATQIGLKLHRGTLKKYPGCTHWHFTRPAQTGTLECNWWPAKNRLWLSIHGNRAAAWQAEAIEAFKALSTKH